MTLIGYALKERSVKVYFARTGCSLFAPFNIDIIAPVSFIMYSTENYYIKFINSDYIQCRFNAYSLSDIINEIERLEKNGFHITEEFKTKILPQIMAQLIGE